MQFVDVINILHNFANKFNNFYPIMQKFSDNKTFDNYFRSLPKVDQNVIKWTIIKRCGASATVFNNWRKGKTFIPKLVKEEIERIAGVRIFNDEQI